MSKSISVEQLSLEILKQDELSEHNVMRLLATHLLYLLMISKGYSMFTGFESTMLDEFFSMLLNFALKFFN